MDPMDPSDWRVVRRTKNCRIEKMTSRTVVGIGNLILPSYDSDQSFCGNLTLSRSEVHALSLLSMAKFVDNRSCLSRLFYGCERFGSFVHLLSECF